MNVKHYTADCITCTSVIPAETLRNARVVLASDYVDLQAEVDALRAADTALRQYISELEGTLTSIGDQADDAVRQGPKRCICTLAAQQACRRLASDEVPSNCRDFNP